MEIFDDPKLQNLREYCLNKNIPLLSLNLSKTLYSLIKASKPKRILEIGTAVGYSAIVMGKALSNSGQIYTFEVSTPSYQKALKNIQNCHLEHCIHIINENFLNTVDNFLEQENNFDLYFIDGQAKEYLNYFQKIKSYLKPGNIVVFDNIIKFKHKMQDFHQYLKNSNHNYTVIEDYEKDDGMLFLFF